MIVEIGQKVNQLTILELLGTRGKAYRQYVRVLCSCGTIKEVRTDGFPKMQSCGCSHKTAWDRHPEKMRVNLEKAREKSRLPLGVGAFNALLFSYKLGAKERGYSFELTKEQFKELTKQNCHYCGQEPVLAWGRKAKQCNNGEYIYNGIDRMDSSLGYTLENCVASCKHCNRIKHATKYDDFLNHIKKIYKYRGL